MITRNEYDNAVQYLADIKKEEISANNPSWTLYKQAIDTKVDYETQQKKEAK